VSVGTRLVDAERKRQLKLWGDAHDAKHVYGEMAEAAAVYVRCALTSINPHSPLAAAPMTEPPTDWPWEPEEFDPKWSDPIRTLVKAGALIAAEIDRLSRAAHSHPGSDA
jgi:hypothetical protein